MNGLGCLGLVLGVWVLVGVVIYRSPTVPPIDTPEADT